MVIVSALAATSLIYAEPLEFKDYSKEPVVKDAEKSVSKEAAPKPSDDVFHVTLDPLHRTLLYAIIQSPVVKINRRLGESFKEGDVLIQLDDTVYKSNFNKASALVEKTKTELDAKTQLYNDKVASLFEVKDAEANVASAETDLAVAQRDLKATKIKAPYDGKVVSLQIEEHELPQTGKDLIEIVYDSTLMAETLIPSTLVTSIEIGMPLKINIKELNKDVDAKISHIGSVIDPTSQTIKIEAEIDNSNGELLAGMKGTVRIPYKPIKSEKNKTQQNN